MQHFGGLGGTEKSKNPQGAESGEDINITQLKSPIAATAVDSPDR
jgi:hypothetical protein